MRRTLMNAPIDARVAIGEGEIDEAPMLYIGEKLGTHINRADVLPIDIAVDPLECTKNCANNNPNAMTVMALSPRGDLFRAPDTYMNKFVTSRLYRDVVSLDFSIEKNIKNISKKSGKSPNQLNAIVLDRPRNQYIVDALQELDVNIEMISDGDIVASLKVASEEADIYMGIGSAPEGVIAATAVKGLNGFFDGKLHFHSDEARARAIEMSDYSIEKKIDINKLCASDNSIFIATGVCDGWIPGVVIDGDVASTSSLLIDVKARKMTKISNSYSVSEINKYILEGVE
jgi:fructose-1,6-bisphosphatase class II